MCGVYDCPLYPTCMIDGSPQVSTKSEERVPAVRSEHQTSPGTQQSHTPKKNRLLWTCGGPGPEERNRNRTEGTKSAVTSHDSKRRALPPPGWQRQAWMGHPHRVSAPRPPSFLLQSLAAPERSCRGSVRVRIGSWMCTSFRAFEKKLIIHSRCRLLSLTPRRDEERKRKDHLDFLPGCRKARRQPYSSPFL